MLDFAQLESKRRPNSSFGRLLPLHVSPLQPDSNTSASTVNKLLMKRNLYGVTSNAQAHRIIDMVCLRCRWSHPTNSPTGQPCVRQYVQYPVRKDLALLRSCGGRFSVPRSPYKTRPSIASCCNATLKKTPFHCSRSSPASGRFEVSISSMLRINPAIMPPELPGTKPSG